MHGVKTLSSAVKNRHMDEKRLKHAYHLYSACCRKRAGKNDYVIP